MKYPKQAVIAKLNAIELDARKRASDAEAQANHLADTHDRVAALTDSYERMGKLIKQGNWHKVASTAYDMYNSAHKIADGAGGPNYSTRDHLLREAQTIQHLSELLAQTPDETVSTTELKDLGILNVIKYK